MEVVAVPPPPPKGSPFRDHDVREWSRIDSITGALERARLETDSWTANTNDACHKYGKVVDSRARTGADGSVQQQASRQLEVFQSRAAGAHLQVVKTKTVSSSRWSGKFDASTKSLTAGFEDLQLPLNPLDISSQKSKASVGRSVNRRPPSRQPRSSTSSFQNDLSNPLRNAHLAAAVNLHRVSRLCHQIHESAVRNAFGRKSPSISQRESGDGSVSGVEITELESSVTSNSNEVTSQSVLSRTKSTSSEDIYKTLDKDSSVKSIEDLEDLEQLQNWRRTSKVRRSLQYPKCSSPSEATKPLDLPEGGVSVKKIREELEKGRRLNTALRNNSVSTNFEALDQIIQSISSASSIDRSSTDENLDDNENDLLISKPKKKRESFVTVESLQEVKGRLRHTTSPGNNVYSNGKKRKDEEIDDGIVTEEEKSNQSRVKSYVYGMENTTQNKKPVISTGSLESRSKLVNGTNNHKNEDWYNRRKSYGFEQVHTQQDSSSISLKNKKMVESSTDSGICRSNDILIVPPSTKSSAANSRFKNSDSESDTENKYNAINKGLNGIHYGNVKKMTSIFDNQEDKNRVAEDAGTAWGKPTFREPDWKRGEIKSTTITIPIVKNNNVIDLPWNDEPEKEIKRHSIAVDEAKYAADSRYRRTSLVGEQYLKNDVLDDDPYGNNRKTKKVEFCKTEVHFAAESGKVNIVATDEKPPPTHNFRRRRRNSGPITNFNEDLNKNGLPMLHFGDTSYEKTMFNVTNDENSGENSEKLSSSLAPDIYENLPSYESRVPSNFGVVTVNTNASKTKNHFEQNEDDRKESFDENIKGILKNKPVKPKPYHLGESVPFSESTSDEDSRRWGVRLRHVPKEDPPIWKSTVTVHNSFVNKDEERNNKINASSDPPEFQKLLRNLRPIKKADYLSDNENRYSDSFANIRVVPAAKDSRRSSWSVADKVEEIPENRGYSTKINFGDGEAIVVENDQSTWPRMENLSKDSKRILNKGLVVRIGRQDSASKHTLRSKTTTTRENNNTTTTTKITIDLSPSPPTSDGKTGEAQPPPAFAYTKFKRSDRLHSFKSTPLVLNTIKDQKEVGDNKIPEQLEALKKLYEDVPSDADSDADKEVQRLMSRITEDEVNMMESDTSSVISGSWSKMKAFRNFSETGRSSFKAVKSRFDLKNGDIKEEKENSDGVTSYVNSTDSSQVSRSYTKYSVPATRSKFSPVVLRKTIPVKTTDSSTTGNVSSPSLVGKQVENFVETKHEDYSSDKEYRNITDSKLKSKYINENVVLRQPKKSEMTYFGVNASSKSSPKNTIQTAVIKDNKISDKPDLLNHYKHTSPTRPRKPSPDRQQTSSPIYENLKPIRKSTKSKYTSKKEFDSSILDELTKAADQILQAVNGYTDEDCRTRLTSDEEDLRQPLDTISETKSWKNTAQDLQAKNQARMRPTLASAAKVRVKRTSSTSSVESLSKDRRKTTSTERKNQNTIVSKPQQEKPKKKVSSDSSSTKASTKARRLQRASSREALLQSHGSSSEDLPATVEVPHRKPRLIKKTKATQLTINNGLELKKSVRKSRSEKVENAKNEERILGSLPEIRHKTAISTIRSTADKCSRDRSKTRNEESRSRSQSKRDSSNKETVSSSSTRHNSSAARNHHHHYGQQQSQHRATPQAQKDSGVTQHRISTANIKKCHRSEGTRH
ncbi:uncharacterized protein LOC115890501 isoform X1 [Sitophilus oryzae]|uniref:Uncharacterized protein LOC115890501 isoform X1 n=1 Tax=Sitophilus oryzae TaxID=7048 RepID=A0A6J2YTI5_SITOR|nr:uncharacterized protein LOC115890501 isoform X1 [Sitophilus oryzae]XP_030766609.1 uncharacterized protein LOC115890501 isoform X1 [Sitophilus oryzae]